MGRLAYLVIRDLLQLLLRDTVLCRQYWASRGLFGAVDMMTGVPVGNRGRCEHPNSLDSMAENKTKACSFRRSLKVTREQSLHTLREREDREGVIILGT